MAEVNAPVLETVLKINEGVAERSGLDAGTLMPVRIAALESTGLDTATAEESES
jgi:hypothetical protein